MCVEVVVIDGGAYVYCKSVGQLADALGKEPAQVSPDEPHFCLCNAYLDELGARAATDDEGAPMVGYAIDIQREAA